VTVARTVLREQIKEILLERILCGELEPGERLVEMRLARELGTSQAPVREALRDLQLLRLVESEPFRGARVRAVDDAQLLPVFPVRAALEDVAAREAAGLVDGEVAPLQRELDAMRAAAADRDWRAQVAHDVAFHRTDRALAGAEARKHVRRTERVVRSRTRHGAGWRVRQ
jgi:DNA-binding GntR family transcriptional regulator